MIRVSSAKVFCKEESISKKYLSKNFSTFFFFGDLEVNFVVTVFYPNNVLDGQFDDKLIVVRFDLVGR